MDLIPIVGVLSSSATVVLIVYFVTRSRQRRAELQVEMQSKLIDRFGSAPELIEFLQSPAGRQFISGVQTAPAALAHERILSGMTRSIILTSLGGAFIFLGFYVDDDFFVPASILLSLGIGYIAATIVSHKLTSKWNLNAVQQL